MESKMISVLKQDEVIQLVKRQLESFTLPMSPKDNTLLEDSILAVYPRLEVNFANSINKYFFVVTENGRVPRFDPYHSIQWMTFLYYLSRELYLRQSNLCDKVYYLNKIMHSVDLFYAIELPDIWSAEHPLGSVLGRAHYSDQFYFFQGCTVGGTGETGKEVYPILAQNVCMYAHSTIVGDCRIGQNVKIGAGALIKNQDVPDNTVVFGQSPNLIFKANKNPNLI